MELRSIIGKTAHRHSLLLKNEKANQFYLLWGIVDVVEPDMQDYSVKEQQVICKRSQSSSGRNPYNVYYTHDIITLDEQFLKSPENAYVIDNEDIRMFSATRFHLYPNSSNSYLSSSDEDNNCLKQFLPKRDCGFALHIMKGDSSGIEALLEKYSYLVDQLSEVSAQYLHVDIRRYSNVLGNVFFIHYHSEFRNVEWRVCPSLKGLLGRVKYRKEGNKKYRCFAVNSDRNGLILESNEIEFSTGERYVLVPFKTAIDQMEITIVDNEGQIVFYKSKMFFIRSINLGLGINSMNVALKRRNNLGDETTEIIPKYSETRTVIGKDIEKDDIVIADSKSFEQAEKDLRFIFFDGDKNEKEANLQKAQNILLKIQNLAYNRVVICDPYFGADEFYRYVFRQKSLDVNVWILTSKNIGKDQAKSLNEAQSKYNQLTETDMVACRVMRGISAFHDRFLIVDDRVWILGTSFNNFGERATSIALVSEEARAKIISKIEAWWYDDSITEDLGSYATN